MLVKMFPILTYVLFLVLGLSATTNAQEMYWTDMDTSKIQRISMARV